MTCNCKKGYYYSISSDQICLIHYDYKAYVHGTNLFNLPSDLAEEIDSLGLILTLSPDKTPAVSRMIKLSERLFDNATGSPGFVKTKSRPIIYRLKMPIEWLDVPDVDAVPVTMHDKLDSLENPRPWLATYAAKDKDDLTTLFKNVSNIRTNWDSLVKTTAERNTEILAITKPFNLNELTECQQRRKSYLARIQAGISQLVTEADDIDFDIKDGVVIVHYPNSDITIMDDNGSLVLKVIPNNKEGKTDE